MSTVFETQARRWSALVLAATCASGAGAHHSFGGIYDAAQALKLTGTVREFLLIHPHPFLVVEVRDAMPEGAAK